MQNATKHAKNVFETIDHKHKGRLTLKDFVKVSIPEINER